MDEGYWAYEDETAWQSQAWDEWQEDSYDDYGSDCGYFQGKGKKGKKGKGKGKKGHGPQGQGKGQGDGKGEANYVNPSHSAQSNSQQAALPSSSNASGFFVTHSSMYLTPVKMIENEDQQKEPDSSGCAFLGQEPDSAMKVGEEGIAFHTENQMPPTVAILDLSCTRAIWAPGMLSMPFVTTWTSTTVDYGTRLNLRAQDSSLQILNKLSALRSWLFICMIRPWSVHTTEFDIVEEGNVPLLMSLPQMRNLGFQFDLSPQQSFLNCTRLGMWKHKLRMSKSTHLVMDFQDIAWYMSTVYFKTPDVQSFFSQFERFEYS